MQHPFTHTRFAVLSLALIAGTAIAATTPATHAQREINVAIIHATVATRIDTLAGAQLHLHHVVNCLVGEHGRGYDAAAEALSANPCKGLGAGAIADSEGQPAMHRDAQMALRSAVAGIQATDLKIAHADAATALNALRTAQAASSTPANAR